MDSLARLFGGSDKVKVMRLFILNPELTLTGPEVARRARISPAAAHKELVNLEQINFLKTKTTLFPVSSSSPGFISVQKGAVKLKTKRQKGWQFDSTFSFASQLRSILRTDILGHRRDFLRRFNHCGKIKFLAIAGIFIDAADSRADLVIVGDQLKKRLLEKEIQVLESEIGKELVYGIFDTADFLYRLNACDKFVRDLLDYPHEKIIDRLSTDNGVKPAAVL